MSVAQIADRLGEALLEKDLCDRVPVLKNTVLRYLSDGLKVEAARQAVVIPAYKHETFGYMVWRKDLEWWIEEVFIKKIDGKGGRPRVHPVPAPREEKPYVGKDRRRNRGRKNANRDIVIGVRTEGGASHIEGTYTGGIWQSLIRASRILTAVILNCRLIRSTWLSILGTRCNQK
jgi:hypothetical protein